MFGRDRWGRESERPISVSNAVQVNADSKVPPSSSEKSLFSWFHWVSRLGQLTCPQAPRGYPSFSLLLGTYPEFQNFRRFRGLRMRMLLLQQDKVTQLEDSLRQLDLDENDLFIQCSRLDKNPKRQRVLKKLETEIAAYDRLLQSTQWAINAPSAIPAHVQYILKWLGTGKNSNSIARKEVEYLDNPSDLLNVGYVKDPSMVKIVDALLRLVEFYYSLRSRLSKRAKKAPSDHETGQKSEDGAEDEKKISRPLLRAAARTVAAIFTIFVLLVPIILLNIAQTTATRFTIIFLATGFFIAAVTAVSKATMAEVFIAGATYSAVLVVFVASNGPSGISGSTTGGGSTAVPTAR